MRRLNPTEEEIRVAVDRAKSHYHDHVKHQLTEADKGPVRGHRWQIA